MTVTLVCLETNDEKLLRALQRVLRSVPSRDGLPRALRGAGVRPSRSALPAGRVLGPPKALQEMEKLLRRVSAVEVKVTIAPHGAALRQEVTNTGLFFFLWSY